MHLTFAIHIDLDQETHYKRYGFSERGTLDGIQQPSAQNSYDKAHKVHELIYKESRSHSSHCITYQVGDLKF